MISEGIVNYNEPARVHFSDHNMKKKGIQKIQVLDVLSQTRGKRTGHGTTSAHN